MTEAASTRPVVEIAGVSKVFQGRGQEAGRVEALLDIDLSITAGEFVSLIGPSGCGKSTLLRLIGDLTSPTSGAITVNGKPASRARQDRDYGMVFQAPILFDWRTVQGNVELPLEISGAPKGQRTERALEHLRLVELSDFAGHYPWQLSGGMQQRVAIARALAYQPTVLLMDEPFASVDAQTRGDLEDLVLRVRDQFGITILFVTHDIDESVYLSDRIVVLTHAPTVVKDVIGVELPSPRDQIATKELPEFAHRRAYVYRLIKHDTTAAPPSTLVGEGLHD